MHPQPTADRELGLSSATLTLPRRMPYSVNFIIYHTWAAVQARPGRHARHAWPQRPRETDGAEGGPAEPHTRWRPGGTNGDTIRAMGGNQRRGQAGPAVSPPIGSGGGGTWLNL